MCVLQLIFFFQAEDGIRDYKVTGVQTCALPIWLLGLCPDKQQTKRPCWSSAIPLVGVKSESLPVVAGAVGKVEIPPLLRDFQTEGESPAFGLLHAVAFSTAPFTHRSCYRALKSNSLF